jgi:hypothetical protein
VAPGAGLRQDVIVAVLGIEGGEEIGLQAGDDFVEFGLGEAVSLGVGGGVELGPDLRGGRGFPGGFDGDGRGLGGCDAHGFTITHGERECECEGQRLADGRGSTLDRKARQRRRVCSWGV